ncbi:MAG: PPC domain-containing DNA-binding protein [Methanomassiliicoccales archaeon]|jgi:predicted DNA-binding protein with PD1-like motif
MKYTQGKHGRVFVVRLEDGEVLHEKLEDFAEERRIGNAVVWAIGGADKGSRLVVGPKDGIARPIDPMENRFEDVHELSGVGTIFPNEDGKPVLHMHAACGRKGETATGCVRRGVRVWQVMEVVIQEITGVQAIREMDSSLGFELLVPRMPKMTDLSTGNQPR